MLYLELYITRTGTNSGFAQYEQFTWPTIRYKRFVFDTCVDISR